MNIFLKNKELILYIREVVDIIISMDIIKILLQEIENCRRRNITRYRIAQDTGVSEVQLHRLVNGGSLQAEAVGKLLEYFGYELRKKGRNKR